jgi:hypothetical protein
MTTERRAVGYVRLSKGDDLATQVEDVQNLAAQRGLKLAHTYRDESISAAELNGRRAKHRPGFEALMAAVRQRLEELAQLVADGLLDTSAYAAAVGRLNERQTAAQAVLDGAYQDAALAGVVDADDVRAAVDALPLDRFRHVLGVLFESITLLPTKHAPKTNGFVPSSVVAVLRSGKPKPAVEGETVTLDLGAPAVARSLADTLRSGGWPVQLRRGGRLVVPADAAAVTQQWKADWDLGFTYDLDPQSAVAAAVRRIAAGAPELTDEQREAVRAALA